MFYQHLFSSIAAIALLVESYRPVEPNCPLTFVYVLAYFAYDAVYNKLSWDFLMHHGVCYLLLSINLLQPFTFETRFLLCRAEWSTLVMNCIPFAPKRVTHFLTATFVLSFFKFRIYDTYTMLQQETFTTVQIAPILAMYTLNLYWFVLICKKMCKPLKTKRLHMLTQNIVSYTLMMNNLLTYVMYPTLRNINLFGALLGLSSYLYHQEVVVRFQGVPSIESKWIWFDLTVFHAFQSAYMYLYTNSFLSTYVHAGTLLYQFTYVPHDVTLNSFPSFAVDGMYLMYANPSIELYTIALLVAFIHTTNAMYDLSYVATHAVICWYIHTRCKHLVL